MSGPVSGDDTALGRLSEVIGKITAIADREELIARDIRIRAATGGLPAENFHRAHLRADTLMRLVSELRAIAGAQPGHIRRDVRMAEDLAL